MKLKLYRDNVISIVDSQDLVGVYVKVKSKDNVATLNGTEIELPDGTEILLAEMSPQKADRILEIWNATKKTQKESDGDYYP